jgi:hypothetical protein
MLYDFMQVLNSASDVYANNHFFLILNYFLQFITAETEIKS